jgi:hypothetical protein
MKLNQLYILLLFLGFYISCEPADPCDDLECGLGNCIEGVCDCPCGFSGDNCEIEDSCFGIVCCNGDCDPQTESCNCDPNYYGESCNILCVNGEFVDGNCNCFVGYEGATCEIESRDAFLGWWSCEEWTWTSEAGDLIFQGPLLGSVKFECGNRVPEIELFSTENSNGLMLLNSANRLVGQVTGKTINFELQFFIGVSVYGSAILDDDRIVRIELYFLNLTTSVTEVAKGRFRIARHWKDCD